MTLPHTVRLSSAFAVAVAISLPWSTSATAILIVLWLLTFLPSLNLSDLRRVVVTPVGGLPVLLWALSVLGMLWAAVPWLDRFHGVASFHRLLIIPLLFAQQYRSNNGRRVLVAYLLSCTVVLAFSLVTTLWPIWRSDNPGVPFHDQTAQSAEFTMCAFALGFDAYMWSSRDQRCDEAQASIPIRHGGSFSKNPRTYRRFNCRRMTTLPSVSTAWTWKTDFAMSRPIVVTVCMGGSFDSWEL